MIIEERRHNELNLESIDNDLRMERVRQGAEKLGWDHFSKSVRRNLLEKRQTLSAQTRLDVLSSLAFMKEKMPIDESVNVAQKVKQLAESFSNKCAVTATPGFLTVKNSDFTLEIGVSEEKITGCKICYFGQPLFDAPEALALMKAKKFTDLRDAIADMVATIPKDITQNDKSACKDALRALEQLLIREASDASFASINTSKYGFYSPRTEVRPGRLYYIAEPMIVRFAEKEGKSHADSSYLDLLPYVEISLVKHEKVFKLPVFSQNGEWTEFNDANVCVCVKFKHPFLFSQQTIRKLAHIVPRSPLVRHYVNFYRYMSSREISKQNLELLTQFPDEVEIQHYYDVESKRLTKEDDVVAVEMFLADLRGLPKLVETLRSEWMHASLWESCLAMCEPRQGVPQKEVKAVNIHMVPRRSEFHLQFDTSFGSMTILIAERTPGKYVIKTTSQLTGESPNQELDQAMSDRLNSTWSIPATLTFILADLDCRLFSLLSPIQYSNLSDTKAAVDFDKLRQAWLSPTTQSANIKKQTPVQPVKRTKIVLEPGDPITPTQLVYTREDDKEFQGSLLASFGDVDEYYVQTSTIGKTRAQPRPKRAEPSHLNSMNMMTADIDGDKGRQSTETPSMMRQQEMQRMSLLESARVQMKQSIGAAHAVGLASHQPSSAPGPMRQHSFTMGYDSVAPYDPNIPASIQFPDPTAFGKGKPRKSRAKKQPGEEGAAPAGRGKGRKGRGAGAVGGAGGRKSTGVAENPFAMDPMRPPLQRSFSDYPGQMNPHMNQYQQMHQMQQHQFQQSQQYRMHQQQMQMQHHQQQMSQQMQSPMHQSMPPPKFAAPPYPAPAATPAEEDSESKPVADEECDPPPPPKPIPTHRPSHLPPHQLGNPMVGYPGMPLQSPNHLPLTPSPLSAPPKPFSPEHHGMRMREPLGYKEGPDIKPDVALLKQQMAAAAAAATAAAANAPPIVEPPSSLAPLTVGTSVPTTPTTSEPLKTPITPTPKKKGGLEAMISKLTKQQEQTLAQQKFQQQPSISQEAPEEKQSEKPKLEQNFPAPPQLEPHQERRAKGLADIFTDDAEDSPVDTKPVLSALQQALSANPGDLNAPGPSSSSSSHGQTMPVLMPNLKREVMEEEPEKEKLVLKIPRTSKPSSVESPKTRNKEDRRDDRKDRDRESEKDRERSEREEKAQKEKDKKERERERRRQRDRERAEQKRAEKKEQEAGKEKESTTSSSSKKRKLDKKDEKDKREPDRKKGKSDHKTTTSMLPTLSLKHFKIPKKDTAEEDKKEAKDDGPSTSASTLGPAPPTADSSRKESSAPSAAPISRKESTSAVSSSSMAQRKESFTAPQGSFASSDHHREPPKKKPPLPPLAVPPIGIYPGPPAMGPPGGNRGGNRKPPIPPPMPRGPPPEQLYRERPSNTRGYPPSSHYHGGGGSSSSKQVASYAQGLPPGMGPPAAKPHGGNYQASQWVRPPTHRDSHSYHFFSGMPQLGPPQQLQREPPPPPPPQMIPLPREREPLPPVLRENPRERPNRAEDDTGPDSPEEGALRIDDE